MALRWLTIVAGLFIAACSDGSADTGATMSVSSATTSVSSANTTTTTTELSHGVLDDTSLDDLQVTCTGGAARPVAAPSHWDVRPPDFGAGGVMGTLIPVPFPDGCETVSELFVGHDGDEPARVIFVASAAARLDAAPSALETEVAGQRVFLAEGELLIRPVVSGRDRPLAIVVQRKGDVVFLTTKGMPLSEATAYVEEVLGR